MEKQLKENGHLHRNRSGNKSPQKKEMAYEQEKQILLELSKDLTSVREKNDLIKVFSSRLKSFFYFSHAVISLIDKKENTYHAFLIDRQNIAISHRDELPGLLASKFDINDPFIGQLNGRTSPVSFPLDEIMDLPKIPAFLKINYECGIRKAMIGGLVHKNETIGYVFIYSDQTDSFTDTFKNVLNGILPHLANAVSNILINQKIAYRDEIQNAILSLSSEMVPVRTREQLYAIFKGTLGQLIYHTQSMIMVVRKSGNSYEPFLVSPKSRISGFRGDKRQSHPPSAIFDGFYNVAGASKEATVFDLDRLALDKAPLWVQHQLRAGTKEILIKHLSPNNDIKYSMVLCSDKHHTFDQRARDIINHISSQMAIAVNNVAAYEEIVEKDKEKTFLLSLSQALAALRSRQDLLQVLTDHTKDLFAADGFGITTINEDGLTYSPFITKSLEVVKTHVDYPIAISGSYKITDPIFKQVMTSEEPIVLDLAKLSKNPATPSFTKLWKNSSNHDILVMALKVGGKNIGMIVLFLPKSTISKAKKALLKAVCAQLSVSVSNIMANERLQHYKSILEVENDYLKEQIKTNDRISEIIGKSQAMQNVFKMVSLVADSDFTTLLLGETGTGKELIAKAIHESSLRKNNLMVKVNCAALATNLIESELFGHEKSAFTGATERRIGKFELANKGTLFLDEIGEMPLETQAKLLRILQERELERLGGSATIKIDVRIIAATNRNLEAEVKAGRFRSDLYYRLNVFPIKLPPLRERNGDIEKLVEFFLHRYSHLTDKTVTTIAPKAMAKLKTYHWPGNIRELEHLIERSVLLAEGKVIQEIHLPQADDGGDLENLLFFNRTLEEMERTYITEILKRCSGKIAGNGGASELLDLPSTTLHSKMKKLGIHKEDYMV